MLFSTVKMLCLEAVYLHKEKNACTNTCRWRGEIGSEDFHGGLVSALMYLMYLCMHTFANQTHESTNQCAFCRDLFTVRITIDLQGVSAKCKVC